MFFFYSSKAEQQRTVQFRGAFKLKIKNISKNLGKKDLNQNNKA